MVVDIEARGRLARPVTLAEIKALAEFEQSPLVRQGRLSVVPLTAAQWKAIEALRQGLSGRVVALSTVGSRRGRGAARARARRAAARGLRQRRPGRRLALPLAGRAAARRGAAAGDQDARRDGSRRCARRSRELHPYELPELVASEIDGGQRALPGVAGCEGRLSLDSDRERVLEVGDRGPPRPRSPR